MRRAIEPYNANDQEEPWGFSHWWPHWFSGSDTGVQRSGTARGGAVRIAERRGGLEGVAERQRLPEGVA